MYHVADANAPGTTRVSAIVAMTDPVIRNLEITECYADLSDALRNRIPGANWCTFATWASRQAGATIRGEDLIDRFERRLGQRAWIAAPIQSLHRVLLRKGLFDPETRLGRAAAVIHTPFDAFERASASVAEGNLRVFAEIGREFARYLEMVPAESTSDSPEFAAFTSGLRAGPPPDGQDLLKAAFRRYQQQRHESDPAVRAALILLANLEIGLHEQTRLQPLIAAAVDAPLITAADLGARVLHALFPSARRLPRVVHGPVSRALGWIVMGVRTTAVRITREVVTESMMVLRLPGIVLRLGQNLQAPTPAIFRQPALSDLDAFVKEYDPCAPGADNCGANDWCDLRQRMHYILHLFRAYAENDTLFSRPFSPAQVAAFRAGVVPDGTL